MSGYRMKKKYLIGIVITAVLSVLVFSLANESSEFVWAKQQKLNILTGTVYDASMNTIVVSDAYGNKYAFVKSPDVVEAKNGTMIGAPVKVQYYGTLNLDDQMQKVSVVKIIVSTLPNLERAKEILGTMSLQEKVGQMFIVRCPDLNAISSVKKYSLGGYVLFAKDFKGKTKKKIISDIASYQKASKIKMLIGVDEEGGTVNRVSTNKSIRAVPFWSAQQLYIKGGWKLIESDTLEKAQLLKSLGINVNLAPVCDISTNPTDFIYSRSFGKNAQSTAEYVRRVIKVMNENKIGNVLKHFPGYGNNVDTHTGIALDKRKYETFKTSDFVPFIAGINQGADAVLVSHNIVACMDPKYPASLSATVHKILRDNLGFTGVIMTDDLYMDAIKKYTANNKAAVLAVKAGNDLLCTRDFEVQIPAVIEAVKNGSISEAQINESVLRILRWKLNLMGTVN